MDANRISSYIRVYKKAIVSIQGLVAALHQPIGNRHRCNSYPHPSTVFDLSGIDFKIEYKIVWWVVYDIIELLYFSKDSKINHILKITLDRQAHYWLFTNLARLASNQLSKWEHQKHISDGCLQFFNSHKQMQAHSNNDCTHIVTRLPLD